MIISVRRAAIVSCIVLHLGVTEPGLAAQALPRPHDGDIRVVYWELRDETTVSLTLEPKRADGTPTPPGVLLTLTLNITGTRPEHPPEYIEMRAYAGFMWAPQVQLSVVLNDRERIDLAPEGLTGLVGGGVSDYVPARVPLPTLKQIAAAKSVRVNALGLEFELTDSQRQAVRTFVDRILSDDPAQPKFRVGFTGGDNNASKVVDVRASDGFVRGVLRLVRGGAGAAARCARLAEAHPADERRRRC